ncbi:MAG TPA: hypothetical protein DCY79_03895 [Planctomycetaceae bacterium]|nr:hypothetical protein [Blastopirellula sp.]HAY78926.1 hypothetical protein [Planctomycetaceae bacterium]
MKAFASSIARRAVEHRDGTGRGSGKRGKICWFLVEKVREKLKGDGFIRRFSNATRVVSTDMRVDMLVKPACETLLHAGDPVD